MVTTNTASPHLSSTYVRMRQDCETFLGLAQEIETFARARTEFWEDEEFQRLKGAFKHTLEEVISVAIC